MITLKVSPFTSDTSWQSLPSKSKLISALPQIMGGMRKSSPLCVWVLSGHVSARDGGVGFHTGLLLMGQPFCGPSGYIHSKTPLGINYGTVASLSATCLNTHASQTSTNQQTHGCEHAHNTQNSPDCSAVTCGWTEGSSAGLSCQWKFEVSLRIRKQEGKMDCNHYSMC